MVDALGNPLAFFLTPSQAHDLEGADALLPQMKADTVLADKAFDADERVIEPLLAAGKTPVIPPKSKRTQLGTILSVLANLKPTGQTNIGDSLFQLASMIKGKSLVMLFSDLLPTTDNWKVEADAMIRSLYRLRYSGHEVIVFHILDVLEAKFPLAGLVDFQDVESDLHKEIDAQGIGDDYRAFVDQFRTYYRTECSSANVDYVPMDTSVGFDKALLDYLILRQRRFG